MTMINVVDYLPYDTHDVYDGAFGYGTTINTVVTSLPSPVDDSLADVHNHNSYNRRNYHRNKLIVGLDVEWRPNSRQYPNNPVATLQLCVGHRCPVFQIIRSPYIPQALIDFLGSDNNLFVGVGIQGDVRKLLEDYSLCVENCLDLRALAADVFGDREMRRAGLRTLALTAMGAELEKPEWITRSRWGNVRLTDDQVKYASVDAFMSFEIGMTLFRYGDE